MVVLRVTNIHTYIDLFVTLTSLKVIRKMNMDRCRVTQSEVNWQ